MISRAPEGEAVRDTRQRGAGSAAPFAVPGVPAGLALLRSRPLTDWQRMELASAFDILVDAAAAACWTALCAADAGLALMEPPIGPPPWIAPEDDGPLTTFLLFRVEEKRRRGLSSLPDPIETLVSDGDHAVAVAASALKIARRGARACLLDLPAGLRHNLLRAIMADFRKALQDRAGAERADALIAYALSAAEPVMDADPSPARIAARLVQMIDAGGRLDGPLLAAWARAGEISLFAAGLARRLSLPVTQIESLLVDEDDAGASLLLRAAGFARDDAMAMLAGGDIAPLHGPDTDRLVRHAAWFDAASIADARAAIASWRAGPAYSAASSPEWIGAR